MDALSDPSNSISVIISDNETFMEKMNDSCLESNVECVQHSSIYMDKPEDMLNPLIANPSFLTIVLTHFIIFFVGVTGNGIVIAIWSEVRPSRSPTCTFLVSLAVADLLLLLIYVPLETAEYFVVTWDASGWICKISSYFEMLSGMASVLNLTAVSFERFLVITFPMKARRFCSLSKCRKGLVIVWMLALLLSVPVSFTKRIHPITYFNNHTSITAYYCFDSTDSSAFHVAVYQLLSMFAFPALFMSFCYLWVIRELWSSTKAVAAMTRPHNSEVQPFTSCCRQPHTNRLYSVRQSRTPPNRSCALHRQGIEVRKERQQLIKMLIFVVALFMICWGPRLIMNVAIKQGLEKFNYSAYGARIVFYLMSFVHSALNPFVYGFMSSNFRRILMQSCATACPALCACGIRPPSRTSRTETVEFSTCTTSLRRSRTRSSLELVERNKTNNIADEDGIGL